MKIPLVKLKQHIIGYTPQILKSPNTKSPIIKRRIFSNLSNLSYSSDSSDLADKTKLSPINIDSIQLSNTVTNEPINLKCNNVLNDVLSDTSDGLSDYTSDDISTYGMICIRYITDLTILI
jgi:hypothetical protein